MSPSPASWVRRALTGLLALVCATPAAASAQSDASRLDLYDGIVLGSPRIVAMGGSVAAIAEDMTGTLATAAAMAFRPPGSEGSWDWDIYVDAYRAPPGTDLTNTGLASDDALAVGTFAGGGALYLGSWGIALAASGVSYSLPSTMPAAGEAPSPTEMVHQTQQLTVGRAWLQGRLGVGVALLSDEFVLNAGDSQVFNWTKLALAPAATFRPHGQSYRIGASARLPSFASAVANMCGSNDPTDCRGFVRPTSSQLPWQIGLGFAWRFARSAWNADGATPRFRDERALFVAADLELVSAVPGGLNIASFVTRTTLASSPSPSLVARLGAEYEIMPGRLRLRAGSYWEPGRVAGRTGRVHGTGGLEVRLFGFSFRDRERRVRLALAVDAAERYQNSGLSIGFWH